MLLTTASACALTFEGSYDLRSVNPKGEPVEGCIALRYDIRDSTCKAGCVGMTIVCSVSVMSVASRGEIEGAASAEGLEPEGSHWTETSSVRPPGAPVLFSSRVFSTVDPGTREPNATPLIRLVERSVPILI